MKKYYILPVLAITAAFAISCNHKSAPDKPVSVTDVSVSPSTLTLEEGETAQLTVTILPENAGDKAVSWSSSNPAAATVEDGLVSGVAEGEADVTVTTHDGGFSDFCHVVVTKPVIPVIKMEVEALPDMTVPRADLALFYCGDELVAAGGHSNGFRIQSSAEYLKDGEWHGMQMSAAHDMPFFTKLPDGKWMIGGGCSSDSGCGQSSLVDIYDPSTRSFSALGAQLYASRALTRAITMGDGNVLVSGNWYESDCMELYSATEGTFSYVKNVSAQRSYPYLLRSAADDAIVFGSYSNTGGEYPEITVDCYKGESYSPDLFAEWKPAAIGTGFLADNCMIGDPASGDYSYLIALYKGTSSSRTYALATVKNGEFALLPTNLEIPTISEYGQIYYAGPVIVDKAKQTGYMFGSTGGGSSVICFVLKIEYAAALSGGKAKLSLYYSDRIDIFPGAGNSSGIVLMPDGRILVAGGIYNSNYSPYSCVYAFKPF